MSAGIRAHLRAGATTTGATTTGGTVDTPPAVTPATPASMRMVGGTPATRHGSHDRGSPPRTFRTTRWVTRSPPAPWPGPRSRPCRPHRHGPRSNAMSAGRSPRPGSSNARPPSTAATCGWFARKVKKEQWSGTAPPPSSGPSTQPPEKAFLAVKRARSARAPAGPPAASNARKPHRKTWGAGVRRTTDVALPHRALQPDRARRLKSAGRLDRRLDR